MKLPIILRKIVIQLNEHYFWIKFFLNRFFGLPIMILILFLGFVLIFNFSVPTKDFLSDIFVIYLPALFHLNTNTWYGNFIEKAIFNSLGIMFSFLPILYSLFFIISIVKQTGLMSRISFMFEGIFNKIGLNGKSIIPLFLGLGCNVTSVFATRIIKNPNQRKATALMAPFISCSARIIVFSLFATIFFPGFSMLIIISLYAIGIIFAILLGYILKLFFWYTNKDLTSKNIKSLPQYNKIKFRIIFKMVNKNIIGYIKGIFSVIFFLHYYFMIFKLFPDA